MPEAEGYVFMDMDVRPSDSTCVLAFHRVRCHQSVHPLPSDLMDRQNFSQNVGTGSSSNAESSRGSCHKSA